MTSEKKKKEITGLLFYLSLIVLPLIQFVIFYIVVNANSIALAFKHYEFKDGQLMVTAAHFDNFVQVIKDLFNKEELKYCFREFAPYEGQCRFNGCDHVHEPDCAVKQAVEEGKIPKMRYQNYTELYQEIKEKKRY